MTGCCHGALAMIRHIFSVAGLLALFAAPARADEAYVCDAGRIVYVKPGELEGLKHTDACIAGYYGLTVEAPAKHDTSQPEAAKKAAKTQAAPPVPPGGKAKGLQLEREARAAAAIDAPVAAAVIKQPAPESKPIASPVKAAPSDFRNVLILNAAPGAERVFRHDK